MKEEQQINEQNNNQKIEPDDKNDIKEIKNATESTEIKANIEMRKENKNKKRKKIKIRSYCSKCYQFFENGPNSKICRNHLKKSCNLIECQKYKQNGENTCIRKFTNINSANRHTHCLTREDVEIWDPNCEIQKCLGKKTEPDNKFLDVLNNNNINIMSGFNKNNNSNNKSFFSDVNNSMNLNLNNINMNFNSMNNLFLDKNDYFFDTNSNNGNNNVIGLIEDIDKLHFNENEKIFNNESHENNDNNNNNEKDINIKLEKMNLNEENKKEEKPEMKNESIDDFFEKVQKETNIPNNIKKKLVNAFKKKGILNVKILILFYEKYKNWDFLIQKFKNVTPQIEGVALCIEFLLKKNM